MARYFEEFQDGEVLLSQGRTITETDVVNFASLSGDWNELHMNEEFARQGYFGRRIAHGALIFSVSAGLMAQTDRSKKPHLIAFYGVDRLRFVKPVFLDDTIHVKETVKSLEPRDQDSGFVTVSREVLNQDSILVLVYTARFLVRRRPGAGTVPAGDGEQT